MILYNNQLLSRDNVHIDIEDRGYQFGDGIYEVIRVYDGHLFLRSDHFSRLERSADEIQLTLPYSTAVLEKYLVDLINTNNLIDGIIYLQVTRGVSQRQHHIPNSATSLLTAYTTPLIRPIKDLEQGIHAILTEDMRWLRCDVKSLNLLGNILAKQKAINDNCGEAILHRGNVITEGSSTNAFGVKNGKVYTHPTTNLILAGVTRKKVLALADNLNIEIIESAMLVKELLAMDEVFITSTTVEVMPVIQINEQKIGEGIPGEVTKTIQRALFDCIY